MGVIKDIECWSEGTWFGVFFMTGLIGGLGLLLAWILTDAHRTPCSEWASGEGGGMVAFTGEEYDQRYDACLRERSKDTP